ncbi:MAG: pseudaminic acid cytidylyltransferase, partial [Gammaproteobacteria bacterium]|nr:pseudaminic acid cytidylyltransferase [Gammaproteobacteria bacterium]
MSNIAIIPARGGSKRIPRKNIKDFLGRPMLSYPIGVARESGLFERIIVSTDDAEIAQIAREQGAETPFTRPPELANDHAGTGPVVQHAIRWLQEQGEPPELVCCIYATTPLLASNYLLQGWQALQEHPDKAFAFSITSFPYPFQRGLKLTAE